VPTLSAAVENVAVEALRVTVPKTATPSLKVMVPLGVPADVVTVATRVTACPYVEGLGEAESAVLVETMAAKDAVTLFGAFITSVWGLVVPLKSPEKPVNWYPAFAVAWTETFAPELNQPPALTLPPAAGLAVVVSRYWVLNEAV
jgi:hypothetical protein